MSNILVLLSIIFTIGTWIIYHKIFRVYYFDLFHGVMKEIICSAFIGFILAELSLKHYWITAILLIITGFALSGRITVPSLKKAIPIIFVIFAVIICVAGILEKHGSDSVNRSSTGQSISEQMESWLSPDEETEEDEEYYEEFGAPEKAKIYESLDTADLIDAFEDSSPNMDEFQEKRQDKYTDLTTNERSNYLIEMGYIGDINKCTMSAEQARAFAALLENARYPVVKAALFDGGNGIPLLWVVHGDRTQDVGSIVQIQGNFGDNIYYYVNGQVEQCSWMTALLRAGDNGIMVQRNKTSSSIKMYRLWGGTIASEPFATATWDPVGEVTFNGQYVGTGTSVSIWDVYSMADNDIELLLQSASDTSDILVLNGTWINGEEMESLLYQYAAY